MTPFRKTRFGSETTNNASVDIEVGGAIAPEISPICASGFRMNLSLELPILNPPTRILTVPITWKSASIAQDLRHLSNNPIVDKLSRQVRACIPGETHPLRTLYTPPGRTPSLP